MSPRSIFFASSTSCAAGLAQEELQRVGRRLLRRDGGDDGRRLLGLGLLDELDPAPVELAVERVLLERVELVRLDDLAQLGRLQRPGLLRRVQQLLELVVAEEVVDVDGGHFWGRSRAFYRDHLASKPSCPVPNRRRSGRKAAEEVLKLWSWSEQPARPSKGRPCACAARCSSSTTPMGSASSAPTRVSGSTSIATGSCPAR